MYFSYQTSLLLRQILDKLLPIVITSRLTVRIDISLVFEAIRTKATAILVHCSPQLHFTRPRCVLVPLDFATFFLNHILFVEQTMVKNVTSVGATDLVDEIFPVGLCGMLSVDIF